ncbi:Phage related protein [Lactobacillus amylovorus GRL 1112]|uniref:Phage related protein n=1 Tax=Lactobacillus amylovorus (strain GRL 1112) TaxID=695560 RepID=E4SIY3_LACAR|nr:phage-like protein [Lactobacillus amylovorus]ADQ59132.1 Phage related protein [Lactobacillus amylovorus GRL 1112]
MSLIRDPVIITAVGHQMMTAGGDITYTKATLYGQDISHLTKDQLESLTLIGNPLLTVPVGISDKSVDGEQTTIALEATFTNANLKADLPYKAVGFFAKKDNGEEKLVILGVANSGAYLAAASPDGVASDALDVKVAIAIGDATSVTAVVDPAGSVTPATLSGAINKATHDLTAKIDTKADKTDVTAQFATKADKTTVEQELTTKANSADVYTKKQVDDALSSRDTAIATKADKATVDAEISKIDFTPYAKTADVNKQIKTVTDLANSKVSADYSYSKAELDKKLLAVTTDTSGKVNANQVASMIADKADKTYVDNQIASIDLGKIKFHKQYIDANGQKADGTWNATKNKDGTYTIDLGQDDWTASKLADVLVQLPNKADTSTVNAQIADAKNTIKSNVDNLHNDLQNQINANDKGTITTGYDWNTGTPTNESRSLQNAWIVDQATLEGAVDRMNSINSNANGRLSLGGGDMNLRSTISWTGGDIDAKTGNLGGLHWSGGTDTASIYGDQNNNDNLDLAFDLGDDSSNHFSFRNNGSEVAAIYSNGHFSGTVDWSNVSGRPDVATHADVNNAIDSIRYAPQERRSLGGDDDANNIVDDGVYRISGNPIKNGNGQSWCFLRVKRWDYNNIYQELDCGSGGIFVRNISQTNKNYPGWQRIATSDDISNLQNIINQQNQTIQSLTSRLNNAENEINYIKANYIEGKSFSKSQEAQATQWENANSQRIAFIRDN